MCNMMLYDWKLFNARATKRGGVFGSSFFVRHCILRVLMRDMGL